MELSANIPRKKAYQVALAGSETVGNTFNVLHATPVDTGEADFNLCVVISTRSIQFALVSHIIWELANCRKR